MEELNMDDFNKYIGFADGELHDVTIRIPGFQEVKEYKGEKKLKWLFPVLAADNVEYEPPKEWWGESRSFLQQLLDNCNYDFHVKRGDQSLRLHCQYDEKKKEWTAVPHKAVEEALRG